MTVKIYGFLGVVNRRTGIIRSEFPLDKQETTIGRQESCDMRLMVANIDPVQAKLVIAEDCATLHNLSSQDIGIGATTLASGSCRPIKNGDIISIGMIHLKYRSVAPANQNMNLSIPPTPVQNTDSTTITPLAESAIMPAPSKTPRKAPALGTPLRTPGTRRANTTSKAQPVQTPKLGTPLRKLVLTKKETPNLGTPRRRPVETPKDKQQPSKIVTTPATFGTTIPTPKSKKKTTAPTPRKKQEDDVDGKAPARAEIQDKEIAEPKPLPPVSFSSLPTSPLHARQITTTESILSTPGAPAFEDTVIGSDLNVQIPPSPAPMSTGIVLDSESSLIPSISDLPSLDDLPEPPSTDNIAEELAQDEVSADGDGRNDESQHISEDSTPDDAFEENSFIAWNTSPNSSLVIDLRTMEHFVSEEAEEDKVELESAEDEQTELEDNESTPRASAADDDLFSYEDTPPPPATPAAVLKAALKNKATSHDSLNIQLGDILPPGSSQLTFDPDEILCSSPLPSFAGQEAMDIDGSSYERYMPELRLESADNDVDDHFDNIKQVDIASVGTPSTDEIIIAPEDNTERAASIGRAVDPKELDETLEALPLPSEQSCANADIGDTTSILANTQDSQADTLPLDSQAYTSMFDGKKEDELAENNAPEDDDKSATSSKGQSQSPVKDNAVKMASNADTDVQENNDDISQGSQNAAEMIVYDSVTAQAGSLVSSEHVDDSQTGIEDEDSKGALPLQAAEQSVDERTVHDSMTVQTESLLSAEHIDDSQIACKGEGSRDVLQSAEADVVERKDDDDEEDLDKEPLPNKESVPRQELLADSQATDIDEARPQEISETATRVDAVERSQSPQLDAPDQQDKVTSDDENDASDNDASSDQNVAASPASEDELHSPNEDAIPLTLQAEAPVTEVTVAETYEEVAQEAAAEAIEELQTANDASPPIIAKRTRGRSRPKEPEPVTESEAPKTPVPTRRRAASKSVKKDGEKVPTRGRQRAASRSASKMVNEGEEAEQGDVSEMKEATEQDSADVSLEEEIVMKVPKRARARSQSHKGTSRTPKAESEEGADSRKKSSKIPTAPKKTIRGRKAADETSDKENAKTSSKVKGRKIVSKTESKEGAARSRRGTNEADVQSSAERPRRGLRST